MSRQVSVAEKAQTVSLISLVEELFDALKRNEDVTQLDRTMRALVADSDRETLHKLLVEKKVVSRKSGGVENAFGCLMGLLNRVIVTKRSRQSGMVVDTISFITRMLVEKCDARVLSLVFSQKRMKDDHIVGVSGVFWLMCSLSRTIHQGDFEVIPNIINILIDIVSVCDSKSLSQLLAEKKVNNVHNPSALMFLMFALNYAVQFGLPQVIGLYEVVRMLIEKCDAMTLSLAFTERLASGPYMGSNALFFLVSAIDFAVVHRPIFLRHIELLALVILKLDASILDDRDKELIFTYKKLFKNTIKQYLKGISDKEVLEKITHKDTLLGQLIDHQQLYGSVTETRQYVESLKAELDAKDAETAMLLESGCILKADNLELAIELTRFKSEAHAQAAPAADSVRTMNLFAWFGAPGGDNVQQTAKAKVSCKPSAKAFAL